jgi:hypothetical protein
MITTIPAVMSKRFFMKSSLSRPRCPPFPEYGGEAAAVQRQAGIRA